MKLLFLKGTDQPTLPGCENCQHYKGLTCDAFPEGIPVDVLSGDEPHFDPLPGDNGIQYEPPEGSELVDVATTP
jgi:hypothetical protein